MALGPTYDSDTAKCYEPPLMGSLLGLLGTPLRSHQASLQIGQTQAKSRRRRIARRGAQAPSVETQLELKPRSSPPQKFIAQVERYQVRSAVRSLMFIFIDGSRSAIHTSTHMSMTHRRRFGPMYEHYVAAFVAATPRYRRCPNMVSQARMGLHK
jgi:hypothetical protein